MTTFIVEFTGYELTQAERDRLAKHEKASPYITLYSGAGRFFIGVEKHISQNDLIIARELDAVLQRNFISNSEKLMEHFTINFTIMSNEP